MYDEACAILLAICPSCLFFMGYAFELVVIMCYQDAATDKEIMPSVQAITVLI
jgi:hypothetical protein